MFSHLFLSFLPLLSLVMYLSVMFCDLFKCYIDTIQADLFGLCTWLESSTPSVRVLRAALINQMHPEHYLKVLNYKRGHMLFLHLSLGEEELLTRFTFTAIS